MKKKQSATGLFFSMFLRSAVVILAIVIACLIFALVRSVIRGGKTNGTEAGTGVVSSENQTDELLTAEKTEAPTEAIVADYGIKIAVLNGTETGGLAGAWKDKLTAAGYTSVDAGNYKGVSSTTKLYYVKENVGQELTTYFPGATVETEMLKEEDTDVVISTHDVLIVIGTSDDIVSKP
ncbi:MAG: LytR C-terminal domain-containing protein [Eubacterium sp.]|nr:LytR C-terminal domain-containing protein [Eubacterium sp.]